MSFTPELILYISRYIQVIYVPVTPKWYSEKSPIHPGPHPSCVYSQALPISTFLWVLPNFIFVYIRPYTLILSSLAIAYFLGALSCDYLETAASFLYLHSIPFLDIRCLLILPPLMYIQIVSKLLLFISWCRDSLCLGLTCLEFSGEGGWWASQIPTLSTTTIYQSKEAKHTQQSPRGDLHVHLFPNILLLLSQEKSITLK